MNAQFGSRKQEITMRSTTDPIVQAIDHGKQIATLALDLDERIRAHQAAFKARVALIPPVRRTPGEEGKTRLRDFVPVNPLDEWLDVTTEPGAALCMLESAGQILVIELEGKYYGKTA